MARGHREDPVATLKQHALMLAGFVALVRVTPYGLAALQ